MKEKEKAEDLIKKFSKHVKYWDCCHDAPLEKDHAKLAAIICVEEIINLEVVKCRIGLSKYYEEVKNQIKLL